MSAVPVTKVGRFSPSYSQKNCFAVVCRSSAVGDENWSTGSLVRRRWSVDIERSSHCLMSSQVSKS